MHSLDRNITERLHSTTKHITPAKEKGDLILAEGAPKLSWARHALGKTQPNIPKDSQRFPGFLKNARVSQII